jgi:cell division protein FtsL
MSANSEKSDPGKFDESISTIPQTPPTSIGYGHPEYNFIQSIMEMQKSLGAIESSISVQTAQISSLKNSVDTTKVSLGRIEKVMYASGFVLIISLSLGGWLLSTAKDFAMVYYKASIEAQVKSAITPPQVTQKQQHNK